ncbi:ABC transporter ATP-binding protein [Lentisphaerota bacterium WC36G]|nr:ABC transporter ATP-binding protein [Lentisphaerae bacterium WC36]
MHDNIALKIENISKKYVISHASGKASYRTLREFVKELAFFWKIKKDKKEDFLALNDINLEINKGDRVAIIGRNGAGKSTLLKLLSRITEPTRGKIAISGRVASLLEVGTGFHPELTGKENIYLNGAVLGMTKKEIESKFDEIVNFSGVEKFLDTPLKRYSSGMQTRLGFAIAANLESEILIVDEVLAVGDIEFQKKCLGKMDEISKTKGRTILFVSHNILAVQNLCNKGIVLDKGEVIYSGNVEDAVKYYTDLNSNGNFNLITKDKNLDFVDFICPTALHSKSNWDFQFKINSQKHYQDCYINFVISNANNLKIIHYSGQKDKFRDIKQGLNTLTFSVGDVHLNDSKLSLTLQILDKNLNEIFHADNFSLPSVLDLEKYTNHLAVCDNKISLQLDYS